MIDIKMMLLVDNKEVLCKGGDPLVNAFMFNFSAIIGGPAQSTLNINNSNQAMTVRASGAQGGAGDANTGIVVGTGSGATTISSYQLGARIANGVGSGQIGYAAQTYTAPTTDGAKRYWKITRLFTNTSGSTITVNEVGLYINFSGAPHMVHRDLTGGVAVGHNQVLTVVFEYYTTT